MLEVLIAVVVGPARARDVVDDVLMGIDELFGLEPVLERAIAFVGVPDVLTDLTRQTTDAELSCAFSRHGIPPFWGFFAKQRRKSKMGKACPIARARSRARTLSTHATPSHRVYTMRVFEYLGIYDACDC
jgi:hypothetical protein